MFLCLRKMLIKKQFDKYLESTFWSSLFSRLYNRKYYNLITDGYQKWKYKLCDDIFTLYLCWNFVCIYYTPNVWLWYANIS